MELLPCRNAYDVTGSCGHPDGSLCLPCRVCSSRRSNVGTLCKQWPQPATDQGRRRFICKDRISKLGIAMALGVNWPRSSKLWNASTKYGRISASCKRGWPRMIYKRLVRYCPAPAGHGRAASGAAAPSAGMAECRPRWRAVFAGGRTAFTTLLQDLNSGIGGSAPPALSPAKNVTAEPGLRSPGICPASILSLGLHLGGRRFGTLLTAATKPLPNFPAWRAMVSPRVCTTFL